MRACDALRQIDLLPARRRSADRTSATIAAGARCKGRGVAVFTIAEPRTATEAAAQLAARLLARRLRSFATLAVLVLGLLTSSEDGDARAEGGSGLAAKDALGFSRLAPLDNSLPANAAPPTYPGGSHGGSFNRPGLVGGFAAGFLGTGVVGLLFGHGMFGGLSGFPAVLGFCSSSRCSRCLHV